MFIGEEVKRIKRIFRNFSLYLKKTMRPESDDSIAVILTHPDLKVRTLLNILIHLDGQKVYLRLSNKLVTAALLEWLIHLPNLYFLPPCYNSYTGFNLVITDSHKLIDRINIRTVHVSYDYLKQLFQKNTGPYLPYIMHPKSYLFFSYHKQLKQLQQNKKVLLAFFGGGFMDKNYRKEKVFTDLNMLTRYDIIKAYQKHSIEVSEDDLFGIIDKGFDSNNIYLINKDTRPILNKNWLKILSHSNFFLCPPGAIMAMCHNLIEAMAVGTIPILNYPKWFYPALCDGVNCLTFETENDLEGILHSISSMSNDRIEIMRHNVISYYNVNLSTESFQKIIFNNLFSKGKLIVLNEHRNDLLVE